MQQTPWTQHHRRRSYAGYPSQDGDRARYTYQDLPGANPYQAYYNRLEWPSLHRPHLSSSQSAPLPYRYSHDRRMSYGTRPMDANRQPSPTYSPLGAQYRRLSVPIFPASPLMPGIDKTVLLSQRPLNLSDFKARFNGNDYLDKILADSRDMQLVKNGLNPQVHAKAFLARLLTFMRNAVYQGMTAPEGISQLSRAWKTWIPKGAVEAEHQKIFVSERECVGYLRFMDTSAVWWKLAMREDTRQTVFEALFADRFENCGPVLAARFARTTGKKIAEMAERISGGGQIATAEGKDKGICRAIPMLIFHKLNLAWTQWGCRRLDSSMKSGQRVSQTFGQKLIEPGCIAFFGKGFEATSLQLSEHGKVTKRLPYGSPGSSHIAIVVGCGRLSRVSTNRRSPHGKTLGVEERCILTLGSQSLEQVESAGDLASLGWLKIVEQARGEKGSPDILPRTTLLDMSTVKKGSLKIYLPMWQADHIKRTDMGKVYPAADGREWTLISGMGVEKGRVEALQPIGSKTHRRGSSVPVILPSSLNRLSESQFDPVKKLLSMFS